MKNDLLITSLIFIILIQFGVSIKNSYQLTKIEKENLIVKKFVIKLDDKLTNYEEMILSLNVEIDSNYKEIEELQDVKRLKKDLVRSWETR